MELINKVPSGGITSIANIQSPFDRCRHSHTAEKDTPFTEEHETSRDTERCI
jgi:hypothetical protein